MKLLKIKAGALQLTMFIVVVIALLLASFILLIHTHKQFKIKTAFVIETVTNAQTGISYALKNDIITNDTLPVSFHDEAYKTITVHKSYWGIFEKIISTSTIKNNTIKKMALVGASQPDKNRVALYVEEHNRPLVVVGNTKIKGLVYLPKQGVRTGNISGHSYYGSQLIYGKTKLSSALPKLLKASINHIKKNYSIGDLKQDQFLDVSQNKTYQNSFYNPIHIVYSNARINLTEVALTGHILVQSKTKIIVTSSSRLKDVILIAPEIEIKNNVNGTFQAIATKSLSVGKNCVLNYPSALVLNKKKPTLETLTRQQKEKQCIIINAGTRVKGIVACLGESKANNFVPQIKIEDKAIVIGEVYCTQNLELKGTIYGSAYTSNFVAKQSGSAYQNHIYNGTIIVGRLPEEYIGLLFKNAKKGVAKWLY